MRIKKDITNKEKSNVGFKRRFFFSQEGTIFFTGNSLLILWLTTIIILFKIKHHLWLTVLTMGFTQLLGGRAASIAQATQAGIHPMVIVLIATYVDMTVVFILYPLMVYSYRHFFERRFFQKHMKPLFESVQKSVTRFGKFKIAGVFLFVWFPFWMTGVIIGSLLGFLLGLKPWINMGAVVLGTMSAAFCWVYAYDLLYSWLGQINKSIPFVVTILVIVGLTINRFIHKHKMHKKMRGKMEEK
jgi:uncharacterized membrane protein